MNQVALADVSDGAPRGEEHPRRAKIGHASIQEIPPKIDRVLGFKK